MRLRSDGRIVGRFDLQRTQKRSPLHNVKIVIGDFNTRVVDIWYHHKTYTNLALN